MINIERIYKYMNMLEGKRSVTSQEFLSTMEISRATLKRDINVLRDRFDVPIVYDRFISAYKLADNIKRSRLPGIWFDDQEIQIIKLLEEKLTKLEQYKYSKQIELLRMKLERACNTNGVG